MKIIAHNIDIEPLLNAASSFRQALTQVDSDLTRDGAIQRFEYTFELCWKTMKRLLRAKGSSVNHPKDVFREAAAEGWIKDPELWFKFLENRNKTVHIYKNDVAEAVYANLDGFKRSLDEFLQKITKL